MRRGSIPRRPLSSSLITNVATTIPVVELGVFAAAPNVAVIGFGIDAETIRYTGKSAASGSGNLTGVTRAYDTAGTYGAAKEVGIGNPDLQWNHRRTAQQDSSKL